MPSHDIIDNRNQKLVDKINCILESSEAAHFAVGYFFISGFTAISDRLNNVKQLRLLIGNTSNRETIEQIAQGYKRLELISDRIEAESYPKRSQVKEIKAETAANVRSDIELLDQTDEAQTLINNLVQMIEEKRLEVKVYTKGTLHAKAYIFDYGKVYDDKGRELSRTENGIAAVGSSNLSLAGIEHNTELNVMVHGNDNHAALTDWFEELWSEAEEFDEALMEEMKQSWAVSLATPYDVYMKTLYTLVRDRLEDVAPKDLIVDNEISKQLADFQKVAVKHAIQNIRDYGGTFVADVVGLGKSFMGAGIAKTIFGLGQSLTVWLPAQFCSSLNFPLLGSSKTALWMEAIPPELQGRVFAANSLVIKLVKAIATLIAGPLCDRILEPAMQSQTILSSLFSPIFGNSAGAGMALLYVGCAIVMFFIGAVGFRLPQLRQLED